MSNNKNTSSFEASRVSPGAYFLWRKERCIPAVEKIKKLKKIKGAKVLEIGCGFGSLSSLLVDKGANVVGTETDTHSLKLARRFNKGKKNIKFITVKDESLKFKDSTFDIVILFDVIEHVGDPSLMMREAIRVLKPKGVLYVEFTPYYSLVGHHLYDYAKWPIHILPKKYIKKIVFKKKSDRFFTNKDAWSNFVGLNKVTVSQFQKFVGDLDVVVEKFIIKYPGVFELNLPFLKYFGPLKDPLCFSFEGIYKK